MDKLTVFTATRIHTMDPGRPQADAVAVSNGRIVSVGTLESMQPWLRRTPYEIDDRFLGRIIFPGFIDPHTHLRLSGTYMSLNYVGPIDSTDHLGQSLSGLPNQESVISRLKELVVEANNSSDGTTKSTLVAWGYDPGMQGGHLNRDILDAISTEIPIWVVAYAPHIIYTNTPMIKKIGVDENSQIHGLGRDPTGRLNGWFVETEATAVAARAVRNQVYGAGFGAESLKLQGQVAVNSGVTTTADMLYGTHSFEEEWDDHSKAITDGSLPLRMFLVPFEGSLRRRYGENFLDFYQHMASQASDRLAVHGVKFVNDGSYPSMTLRLNYPGYLDGEEGLTGEVPWEDMFDRMLPFWKEGIQIHSHANGDETIDMTLNTLKALQNAAPRFDHRFTIEHYCISTPAQARRLSALGGLASVNPYFVHYRSKIQAEKGFGPDRAEATARLGSLVKAGVTFALHSDYNLVVAPMHPLTAVWIAVNRLTTDNKTVVAPGERISLDQALRAITVDAAHVLNQDDHLGSIEVGKHADFTVLDQDPYEVDSKTIKDIRVHGTVLAGKFHPARA